MGSLLLLLIAVVAVIGSLVNPSIYSHQENRHYHHHHISSSSSSSSFVGHVNGQSAVAAHCCCWCYW